MASDVAKLGVKHIFASDLSRAVETAQIINRELGFEIVLDERLREVNFGDFEGRLRETITAEDWDQFNEDPKKFNAEGLEDVFNRVKSFFDDLVAAKIDNAVIVCHGTSKTLALLSGSRFNFGQMF